jgi:L-iditol 2-dehydrogenase
MKAVVLYEQRDGAAEIRDMPVPTIGPNDVLVEVKYVGICGSELHMYHNEVTYEVKTPVILGHEFSGVIAEKGADITDFAVGDRVACETAAEICGHCVYCNTGEYNLCPERKGYGFHVHGAYTKYVRVPRRLLHRVPPEVTLEEAAVVEPFAVAYNALVIKSRILPGEIVAVLGPGPVGLFCVQVARLAGASTIVCSGAPSDAARLQVAKQLGADIIVNAGEEDPVAVVKSLWDKQGAHYVADAAGSSITLKQSLEMVRRNGRITKLGWGPKPVGFSLDLLLEKAITLQGVFSQSYRSWEAVIELLRTKKVTVKPVVTHIMPLTEWKTAYDLLDHQQGIKILLTPVD